jgi:uncharacterized protein (TIGR02284 family)
MASTHETVSVLRDLIRVCREGAEGYRTAAERVDDDGLRPLFASCAEERERYLGELEHEVRRLGEDPRDMPTLGEALEDSWSSIRDAFSSNDRDAIVAGCESGEDTALETWRDALAAPLPEPIREIVARQYEGIARCHEQMRALKAGA